MFFSRPVLGMLLGALIWIATLVPYFVVYNDSKYKAMTRYQIHVYLTSNNQRLRNAGEFQASDPTSKPPCCNAGVLRKFRVIEGQNACVQIMSDRRLFGLSVSSPIYRNNQNTTSRTEESFRSTLVKSYIPRENLPPTKSMPPGFAGYINFNLQT